jgi:hypothetical protein
MRAAVNLICAATARKRIVTIIAINDVVAGTGLAAGHASGITGLGDGIVTGRTKYGGHQGKSSLGKLKQCLLEM